MIDTELLEITLEKLFPATMENYEEKRDIFRTGVHWGKDHPYFDRGCINRVWHYLSEDPSDLPEVNKICLVKFSDGTGGLSSMVYPKVGRENVNDPSNPSTYDPEGPSVERGGDVLRGEDNSLLGFQTKVWVTRYRDDIVAWSYYVMDKVNGVYI